MKYITIFLYIWGTNQNSSDMKNRYTISSKCIFRTSTYNFHHRNKLQESQGDSFKEVFIQRETTLKQVTQQQKTEVL